MDSLRQGLLQGAMMKQQREDRDKSDERSILDREQKIVEIARAAKREQNRDAQDERRYQATQTRLDKQDAFNRDRLTKEDEWKNATLNSNTERANQKAIAEAQAAQEKAINEGRLRLLDFAKEIAARHKSGQTSTEQANLEMRSVWKSIRDQSNSALNKVFQGTPFYAFEDDPTSQPFQPLEQKSNISPRDVIAANGQVTGLASEIAKLRSNANQLGAAKMTPEQEAELKQLESELVRSRSLRDQMTAGSSVNKVPLPQPPPGWTPQASQTGSAQPPQAAPSGGGQLDQARSEAMQAIQRGADKDAVRARFLKAYGQPL